MRIEDDVVARSPSRLPSRLAGDRGSRRVDPPKLRRRRLGRRCLALTGLALALASPTSLGCNTKTRNDVYSDALAARHQAKTVDCKLVYDPERGGNLLSGRDISRCLDANKKALELFEEAQRAGMDGRAFETDLEVQREDVKQLEDMLLMVRRMEVDAPLTDDPK